jgi:hypothetical protein
MVKVNAPLFSLGASGTIAQAATFSSWKGRAYVRERVIPANPRTGPQVGLRAMIRFLAQQWAGLGPTNHARWKTLADQNAISPFNAYTSFNQKRWRSFKGPTVNPTQIEQTTAPAAPTTTATGGIRQVQLSINPGNPAPGWGYMIHRSTTTNFTPSWDNCVAVIPYDGPTTIYVDSNLTPGTYYYRVRGFNEDGKLGTFETQKSATVT